MAAARQLLVHRLSCSSSSATLLKHTYNGLTDSRCKGGCWNKAKRLPGFRARVAIKPSNTVLGKDGIVPTDGNKDGVNLGTVKLPANVDIARFESLRPCFFRWTKQVDKVEGGVRLGFVIIEDSAMQELVYIDCLVSPATDSSESVFRAIKNGPMKDMEPPGEPSIMRSLLQALQKSIQIAQV